MATNVATLRDVMDTAARLASEDSGANMTFNHLWEQLGSNEKGARAGIRAALNNGDLREYLEEALRTHDITIRDV